MAISSLSKQARNAMTPLIEVPEIGWDFEAEKETKSIDEHLKPVATRIRKHWGLAPFFLDLALVGGERLRGGVHPVNNIFFRLSELDCKAIPVTGFGRDLEYQEAVIRTARKDETGLCMRVRLEEASEEEISVNISAILEKKLPLEHCDLILDLGAVNFEPLPDFAELLLAVISSLPHLRRWRTFTLIGTSFPDSMGKVGKGVSQQARSEWLLYKMLLPLLRKDRIRLPTFGDYAINHPAILRMDMRKVSPSANIRYTINDAWLFVKGTSLRRNRSQLKEHCQKLITSGFFFGAEFSSGDKYIFDCAQGRAGTGSPTTWRKIGTVHHLEKLVRDVSSYFDALTFP